LCWLMQLGVIPLTENEKRNRSQKERLLSKLLENPFTETGYFARDQTCLLKSKESHYLTQVIILLPPRRHVTTAL
jgi:hypothetical protein